MGEGRAIRLDTKIRGPGTGLGIVGLETLGPAIRTATLTEVCEGLEQKSQGSQKVYFRWPGGYQLRN